MLALLRKIASRSPHPSHKHATLVMKGGALLAWGFNHDDLHSERVALSKLWPNKRAGTAVINIRVTRSGSIGISWPCGSCLQFLVGNGVQKVTFVNRKGEWETRRIK